MVLGLRKTTVLWAIDEKNMHTHTGQIVYNLKLSPEFTWIVWCLELNWSGFIRHELIICHRILHGMKANTFYLFSYFFFIFLISLIIRLVVWYILCDLKSAWATNYNMKNRQHTLWGEMFSHLLLCKHDRQMWNISMLCFRSLALPLSLSLCLFHRSRFTSSSTIRVRITHAHNLCCNLWANL